MLNITIGQVSPYTDNDENHFGVNDVGLPDGCQIEQVHSLQRHGTASSSGTVRTMLTLYPSVHSPAIPNRRFRRWSKRRELRSQAVQLHICEPAFLVQRTIDVLELVCVSDGRVISDQHWRHYRISVRRYVLESVRQDAV